MAEYFSHDYDARDDEKIIDLMGEHGWAGYGLFWGLIELLYKNGGKMRTQYGRIAFALNSHPDSVQDIIENYGLFIIKNGFFSSKSVNERLKKRNAKSKTASDNAYKRWNKGDANAMQQQCEGNAIKERKVNNSKVKENIYRAFAHLSITDIEYQKLIDAGYKDKQVDSILDDIENYKQNTKYKSLYLTAVKWLKREPVKGKQEMAGRVIDSERAPDNFGVRSPTAVPMPEHLKKKLGKIGTEK